MQGPQCRQTHGAFPDLHPQRQPSRYFLAKMYPAEATEDQRYK